MSKSKINPKTGKPYEPQIAFWPAKSGKGYTTKITDEVLEILTKAKVGGRILLTEVPEEYRTSDTSPHYRVTVFGEDTRREASSDI